MPSTYTSGPYRMWNVSNHVGPGYKNNRTDVLLVQVWLDCARDYLERTAPAFKPFDFPQPDYNGVVDVRTQVGIMNMQLYIRSQYNHSSVVDGVVSPMYAGTMGYGPNAYFTMAWLNRYCYRFEFDDDAAGPPPVSNFNWLMANFWTADIPGELKVAIGPTHQKWK